MSHWTDAHCHLQDRFLGDDEIDAPTPRDALARAYEAGVDRVVVIGTDATTSRRGARDHRLRRRRRDLRHRRPAPPRRPLRTSSRSSTWPDGATRGWWASASAASTTSTSTRRASDQRRAFAAQIALAHELDLALVIHARDAFDDLFDVLDERGRAAAHRDPLLHRYARGRAGLSGARLRHLDLGRRHVQERRTRCARRCAVVPLDRLHVETDSPFLAPVPHRGTTNEPAFVTVVGEFVAELRGESFVEVARGDEGQHRATVPTYPRPKTPVHQVVDGNLRRELPRDPPSPSVVGREDCL